MLWIFVIIIALVMIKDSAGNGKGSHSDTRDMHQIMIFDMMENEFKNRK
ncbi:MAG: hypothetical protein J5590_07885 [Clostridia bacterium]|nr:hypothetical protein [Clostridia bacterium]